MIKALMNVTLVQMAADDNDPILHAAKKLAKILRERGAFTNIATFDLKCEVCQTNGPEHFQVLICV